MRISDWSSDVCSSDLHVVDTTNYSSNDLQQEIRQRFAEAEDDEPALNILSFGFARGLPRHADLVFDMRYLRNPHWDTKLRPGTGLDADVSAYITADPAYEATDRKSTRLNSSH